MRTIKEINNLIKDRTDELSATIESAVESEKDFDMAQNELNQEIKDLQKEVPFENTHIGRIEAVLEKAKSEILKIVDDVEKTTGLKLGKNFFSSFSEHNHVKILYDFSYNTDFGRSCLPSKKRSNVKEEY